MEMSIPPLSAGTAARRAGSFVRAEDRIPQLEKSFGDFWSWAYSDVLSNSNRSVFAEYLVACALGCLDRPRIEWDRCDLTWRGKLIEVKASAYVQSWHQKKLSTISFDIGAKRGWEAATNTSSPEPVRSADCYVFCLFTDRERETCVVTDPARWLFYVVSTETLERHLWPQKTTGLRAIERLAKPVTFDGLRNQVESVLAPLPAGA